MVDIKQELFDGLRELHNAALNVLESTERFDRTLLDVLESTKRLDRALDKFNPADLMRYIKQIESTKLNGR